MPINFLISLLFLIKIAFIFGKPINTKNQPILYAPLYDYQIWPGIPGQSVKEPLIFEQNQPTERTEALINNTIVAGSMLYRVFRVIYRAGTILMSFMPGIPTPF